MKDKWVTWYLRRALLALGVLQAIAMQCHVANGKVTRNTVKQSVKLSYGEKVMDAYLPRRHCATCLWEQVGIDLCTGRIRGSQPRAVLLKKDSGLLAMMLCHWPTDKSFW